MKKWLKWTLGILGTIIIVLLLITMWYWESLTILSGTEGISDNTSTIPEVEESAEIPLETGAADWTSWYGPDGEKRSLVTGINNDWSNGLKKIWEVNYLCQGNTSATWSAPAIRGNHLVACGRDSDNDLVFCLNASNGNLIWQSAYPAKPSSSHGTGSRATPFIDGDTVYTFGRNGDLVCWQLSDGHKVWHKNVADEGGEEPTWGHSSSPLIYNDLVLVQGGGSCGTIAYEKETGNVAWKSGKGPAGYAALKPMEMGGDTIILVFHGTGLAGLDIANGRELWNISWPTDYDVNATTPLVIDDRVFITSGYSTGSMLLKVDQTKADSLWGLESFSSHHSDPYVIDGYLYGYSGDSFQNRGSFMCVDMNTGEEKWRTNDMGWGTCILVDGYLLCSDIKGNIFLMRPDPDKFIQVTNLTSAFGDVKGPVWTMPVVANGKLFLRFKQKMICYDIL